MGAQKEEENVHNFPIYTFDKKGLKPLITSSDTGVYLIYLKNSERHKRYKNVEILLPDGTLTKDRHVDWWSYPEDVERHIKEGADYLGIGVVHNY